MSELRFDGRAAVVTGAGRGLGRSYALMLGARGCQVIVNDTGVAPDGSTADETPAEAVVEEIRRAGGKAIACTASVVDGAQTIIDAALKEYGRLDIVINNAGIVGGGPFETIDPAVWRQLLEVHLFGAAAVTRAAWKPLVASGGGSIINMSSNASFGAGYTSQYSTAKSSMIGFTRSLAEEGAPHGIRVNAIMPSAYTRMTAMIPEIEIRDFLAKHFSPEKVTPFVVWLAHPETKISGEIFSVGAGFVGRVVLAEAANVQVTDDRPESWAAQEKALMTFNDLVSPLSMRAELRFKVGLLGPEGLEMQKRMDVADGVWSTDAGR